MTPRQTLRSDRFIEPLPRGKMTPSQSRSHKYDGADTHCKNSNCSIKSRSPDMKAERHVIPYEGFKEAVARQCCRTLSRCARPTMCESAYTFDCSFEEFLDHRLYPVWYVNPKRTEIVRHDDPQAQAIRLLHLANLPHLVEPKLNAWYKPEQGPITSASLITLYCTGCDRRVLIDGVHRALWLAVNCRRSVRVHVTELSGSQWRPETPDLNVVCICKKE